MKERNEYGVFDIIGPHHDRAVKLTYCRCGSYGTFGRAAM